jgi:hypothetical protein
MVLKSGQTYMSRRMKKELPIKSIYVASEFCLDEPLLYVASGAFLWLHKGFGCNPSKETKI